MKARPLCYHLVAILTIAVWGTTFVNTKLLLLQGMLPLEIFVVRFLMAYCCVWFISPRRLWADTLKDELIFLLLGLTGGSVYFLLENAALGISYASNVSFLVCTAPLITTLLALSLVRSVHASKSLILGSLVAILGMAVVIFNGHFVLKLNPLGDCLALGAAFCWACYSLIIKGVSSRYGAAFITRKVFFYGLLTSLPAFFFFPWRFPLASFAHPVVWANVLFLGFLASFVCFLSWSYAIQKIGAMRTSNYVYLNPITTVVASAAVLHEPMTWLSGVGSALILTGVFFANRSKGI